MDLALGQIIKIPPICVCVCVCASTQSVCLCLPPTHLGRTGVCVPPVLCASYTCVCVSDCLSVCPTRLGRTGQGRSVCVCLRLCVCLSARLCVCVCASACVSVCACVSYPSWRDRSRCVWMSCSTSLKKRRRPRSASCVRSNTCSMSSM